MHAGGPRRLPVPRRPGAASTHQIKQDSRQYLFLIQKSLWHGQLAAEAAPELGLRPA